MERQAFHEALESIWEAIRELNRVVDSEAPWALKKRDPVHMDAVLYSLAESIRHITIILQPFMPDSCGKILDQLSIPENARDFKYLNDGSSFKDDNSIVPGTALPKPEGVFPRFQEEDGEDV